MIVVKRKFKRKSLSGLEIRDLIQHVKNESVQLVIYVSILPSFYFEQEIKSTWVKSFGKCHMKLIYGEFKGKYSIDGLQIKIFPNTSNQSSLELLSKNYDFHYKTLINSCVEFLWKLFIPTERVFR